MIRTSHPRTSSLFSFGRWMIGAVLCLTGVVGRADFALDQFVAKAKSLPYEDLRGWPVMQNGRIKPFESMARETSIFITGSYQFKGLHPIQLIMALMMSDDAEKLPLIEVRSPDLRERLKFPREQRFVSLQDLAALNFEAMTAPLLEKQKNNKRTLNEIENKMIEVFEQSWLLQQAHSGALLLEALSPSEASAPHGELASDSPVVIQLKSLMQAMTLGHEAEFQIQAKSFQQMLLAQNWPEELKSQLGHVELELFYNQFKPFRWACWLFFLFFALMLSPTVADQLRRRLQDQFMPVLLFVPLLFLALGFYLRVTITGFAPVTNMYGTMIWVSLGVGLFGWIFYLIYRNSTFLAVTYFGSFLLLLVTEQMPLVISPDMDPIVAVLRSNLWLSIHVLTITISYAAFSIAMLLGNTMIVRDLLGKSDAVWIKTYGHFCYRAIQLGVFLLSVGIILGGVWADYSWGRFWGWDPKETWALIADLGFLALLHSRLVGWVDHRRLLLLAPLSYLLVIMAWYGVNFILATGLHSYGFSSGGAMVVAVFVGLQLLLVAAAFASRRLRLSK